MGTKQKKAGHKVSDYSTAKLFALLQEGKDNKAINEKNKEIQDQIATYPSQSRKLIRLFEKKRKSLERKLDFIKEKSSKDEESKKDIALKKKT